MKTDAIVEVSASFFAKGERIHSSEIEDLASSSKASWEEATDVIPEEQRGSSTNGIGQELPDHERPDSVFNQDWIGFCFELVSEGDTKLSSGAEWILEEIGPEELFKPFRKDLLEMVKAAGIGPENRMVKVLTAWSYWARGKPLPDDDFDCGIELQGRLDLDNVAVRKISG